MRKIMAKKLSRIARLSHRIFGDIPRELEYRLVDKKNCVDYIACININYSMTSLIHAERKR